MTLVALTPEPGASAEPGRVKAHLTALATKVADAAARVHAQQGGEAVHDLRVSARRLECALDVWRAALPRRLGRRTRRLLARLRRSAGRAREREVHAEALAPLVGSLGEPHRDALEQELARLIRLRERALVRLAGRITSAHAERLWRRVERAARAIEASAPSLAQAAARTERRRRRALEALLLARPVSEDAPLHRARVAVKKWRYAEEALAAGRGERSRATTLRLKPVQSALGHIHDRATLGAHLTKAAARAAGRGETSHAESLTALAAWLARDRADAVSRFRRGTEHELTQAG